MLDGHSFGFVEEGAPEPGEFELTVEGRPKTPDRDRIYRENAKIIEELYKSLDQREKTVFSNCSTLKKVQIFLDLPEEEQKGVHLGEMRSICIQACILLEKISEALKGEYLESGNLARIETLIRDMEVVILDRMSPEQTSKINAISGKNRKETKKKQSIQEKKFRVENRVKALASIKPFLQQHSSLVSEKESGLVDKKDLDYKTLETLFNKRNEAKRKRNAMVFRGMKIALIKIRNKAFEEGIDLFAGSNPDKIIEKILEEKIQYIGDVIIARSGPSATNEGPDIISALKKVLTNIAGHRTKQESYIIKSGKEAVRDAFHFGAASSVVFTEGGTSGTKLAIEGLASRDSKSAFIVHKGDAFSNQIYEEAVARQAYDLGEREKGVDMFFENLPSPLQLLVGRFRDKTIQKIREGSHLPRKIELEPEETFNKEHPKFKALQELIDNGEVDTVVGLTNTTSYGNNNFPGIMDLKAYAQEQEKEVLFIGDHVSGRVFNLMYELVEKEMEKNQNLSPQEALFQVQKNLPDVLITAFQKDIGAEDGAGAGFIFAKDSETFRKRLGQIQEIDPREAAKLSLSSREVAYHGVTMGEDNIIPYTPNTLPILNLAITAGAFKSYDNWLLKFEKSDRKTVQKMMTESFDSEGSLNKLGFSFVIDKPEKNETNTTYGIRVPEGTSASALKDLLEQFHIYISPGYNDETDSILRICHYSPNVAEDFEFILAVIEFIFKKENLREKIEQKKPENRYTFI